jgi:hypothetical protein
MVVIHLPEDGWLSAFRVYHCRSSYRETKRPRRGVQSRRDGFLSLTLSLPLIPMEAGQKAAKTGFSSIEQGLKALKAHKAHHFPRNRPLPGMAVTLTCAFPGSPHPAGCGPPTLGMLATRSRPSPSPHSRSPSCSPAQSAHTPLSAHSALSARIFRTGFRGHPGTLENQNYAKDQR